MNFPFPFAFPFVQAIKFEETAKQFKARIAKEEAERKNKEFLEKGEYQKLIPIKAKPMKLGDEHEERLEKYLESRYVSTNIAPCTGYRSVMMDVHETYACGELDRVIVLKGSGTFHEPKTDAVIYSTYKIHGEQYKNVSDQTCGELNKLFMKRISPKVIKADVAKLIGESKAKASGLFANLFKKFIAYSNNMGRELKTDEGFPFVPPLVISDSLITLMWFDGTPIKKEDGGVCVGGGGGEAAKLMKTFAVGDVGPLNPVMIHKNITGVLQQIIGSHLLKYFNITKRKVPLEFYFKTGKPFLFIMSVHILKELYDFTEKLLTGIENNSILFVDSHRVEYEPGYVIEDVVALKQMIAFETGKIFHGEYVPNCNEMICYSKEDFANIIFKELLQEMRDLPKALECIPTLVTVPSKIQKPIEYFDKKLQVMVTKPGKVEPLKAEFSEAGKILFIKAFVGQSQASLFSDQLFKPQLINSKDAAKSAITLAACDVERIVGAFEALRETFQIPETYIEFLETI